MDGLLHDAFNEVPLKNYTALISRIKLISGLKLNIGDASQDGRFTINLGKKEIEVTLDRAEALFTELNTLLPKR